jgi:hypothetical protein
MSSCDTSSSASPAAQTTTRIPLRLYDITPLYDDKSNFQTQKYCIALALPIQKPLPIIYSLEALPAKNLDKETAPYYEQELEAHALIQLTLSEEPLSGILDVTDTKETWHRLNSHYKGTSKHASAYITGELF